MKAELTTLLIILSVAAFGAQPFPDQRFRDIIKYENQTFDVEVEDHRSALDLYFKQNNIKPSFPELHPAIKDQPRYTVQWEVKTNGLYLVGINSLNIFGPSYNLGEVLSLPSNAKEVGATWFSGTMHLDDNRGQVIHLTFDKGKLVDVADVMVTGSLDGACETREQKNALIDFAKKTFQQPIESIYLTTCWGHPLDHSVAVVRFKRRQLGGDYYEYSRALIYHQERPPRRLRDGAVWKPGPEDMVSGPWFTNRKIKSYCVVRYELRGKEIFLGPPDRCVSYNDIQQLLLSIEEKTYQTAKPEPNRDGSFTVSMGNSEGLTLNSIGQITVKEKDGKRIYEVMTSERPLSGTTYYFERRGESFVLVSSGMWIS